MSATELMSNKSCVPIQKTILDYFDYVKEKPKIEPKPQAVNNKVVVTHDVFVQELNGFKSYLNDIVKVEQLLYDARSSSSPESTKVATEFQTRLFAMRSLLPAKAKELEQLREVGKEHISIKLPSWTHHYSSSISERKTQHDDIIEGLKTICEPLNARPADEDFADQPSSVLVALLKHQKIALKWLQWRENEKVKGGILGDDMGLGKTLTMISLILASKVEDERAASQDSRKSTLVICPASILHQWSNEIKSKVETDALSVHLYHGPSRNNAVNRIYFDSDVIITTYSIVRSDYRTQGPASWLFVHKWKRIVLDEAHIMRNPRSQCCFTICRLQSKYRWALTGTPIQNAAKDAFALMQFLQVPTFKDLTHWRRLMKEGMEGHRRLNCVLKPLLLRRTKAQLQASGGMPPMPLLHVQLVEIKLSEAEMTVYQILLVISKKLFEQFLQQYEHRNADLNYYNAKGVPKFLRDFNDPVYGVLHRKLLISLGYDPDTKIQGIVIMVLLLRLRQFCCHPALMMSMLGGNALLPGNDADVAAEPTAALQLNVIAELQQLAESRRDCNTRAQTTKGDLAATLKLLSPANPIFDRGLYSSKMVQVLARVEHILLYTQDKLIIVSQWASHLTLIGEQLAVRKHPTLYFHGGLNVAKRQAVLDEFNIAGNDKRVLLLSLLAGGLGLNLNVANHLLLIDLHWNPQTERQAQDRVYRYGQQKPTYIYRFCCTDTVEDRIKALQDHKIEIFNVVLNNANDMIAGPGGSLTLQDLKRVFGM
ncbi:CG10445 [Drosophila busckii]|uniref:CG10445 n=2 Tax=Drosophila busckii TaxID=30019 RepID=A0A0M4F2S1_DROBS|nr:CG10445 [Drosophila busckii]